MASVKDYSVEEKLTSLVSLQKIDSKMDEIQILKGELPMEVKDLEDEIEGLHARLTRVEEEVNGMQEFINQKKEAIKEAESFLRPSVALNSSYNVFAERPVIYLRNETASPKVNDVKYGGSFAFAGAVTSGRVHGAEYRHTAAHPDPACAAHSETHECGRFPVPARARLATMPAVPMRFQS